MRQHYLLGYRNRLRYDNFLSKSFDPKEIYIISTDVNRTIMSAYSQLQGLYSPGSGPNISNAQSDIAVPPLNNTDFDAEKLKLGNSALPNKMQVVPIHLFDSNSRQFNLHDSRVCPNAGNYVEKNKEKQILKDFYKKFNNTFGKQLKEAFNLTDYNNFFDYWWVYGICDTFVSDFTEAKNLQILKNVNINLAELNQTAYEFLYLDILEVGFGDDGYQLGTMSMSPTVLSVVDWMLTRINNDLNGAGFNGFPSPKIVMYSAHDTNMGAIQTYLKNVFNKTQLYYTPFASSLFFELYRSDGIDASKLKKEDYTVKTIYNDHLLFEIPFTEFESTIREKSFSPEKIAKFCGFTDDTTNCSFNFFLLTTIILGAVSVLLVIYIFINKRKSDVLNTPEYKNII
jgi:hypothetical protein